MTGFAGVGIGVIGVGAATAGFDTSVVGVDRDNLGVEADNVADEIDCTGTFDSGAAGDGVTAAGEFATVVLTAGTADAEVPAGANAITGLCTADIAGNGRDIDV